VIMKKTHRSRVISPHEFIYQPGTAGGKDGVVEATTRLRPKMDLRAHKRKPRILCCDMEESDKH
jgi:hypothetical protein